MQITFIIIGLIGLLLIVYAIRLLVKIRKNKSVTEFKLNTQPHKFRLKSTGIYAVCLVGAGFVEDNDRFTAELKTTDGMEIELKKTFPHFRFRKNGIIGIEYWRFQPSGNGEFILTFKNPDELVAQKSMLMTNRQFAPNIKAESLNVLIKEVIPFKYTILFIVSLVFGINALIWGILVGLFPGLFE